MGITVGDTLQYIWALVDSFQCFIILHVWQPNKDLSPETYRPADYKPSKKSRHNKPDLKSPTWRVYCKGKEKVKVYVYSPNIPVYRFNGL